MILEQIYTGCLAEAAYYIESEGEAVVIDPLREPWPYLQRAQRRGATIRYIFETHFHADFVSGHLELASKTGATIVFGPHAETDFESLVAKDGQIFEIGKIKIKVMHTPGHTMESSCFLLYDEEGKEHALFSGDTLFINEVGRPDLAVSSAISKESLAGMLYDSLRLKIMPLPDEVLVYPGHGAGSACGKNIGKETFDTLGHQKKINYALQDMSKEAFVVQVLAGMPPAPAYFAQNAMLNKKGYQSLDSLMDSGLRALEVEAFEWLAQEEAQVILDTRTADEFAKLHIPGSINIGLDGQFAPWAGALLPDLKTKILLVSAEGKEEESLLRLARVGYDALLGTLKNGIQSWQEAGKPCASLDRLQANQLREQIKQGVVVLDVRKESEYLNGHMEEALHKPLDQINEWSSELSPETTYILHCAGGYRSMIAASILRSRGFVHVRDVIGGFTAIQSELGISSASSCSIK
ncbi:MAG: MBL fold metallo-hydrolase [Cytophagaceae bacterium]|jgi:glyoxylase-like metal-dependent hydrolase (beta-lactamase superfamily II)/rhodanese-related sulfurtransferase|nr:MBL fold metallo-hydrolase [Cytophagaceae bacterium]